MKDEFDAAAIVAVTAPLLGLSLDPAHVPGVVANLERTAQMASLFLDFELPDEIEAAPVFRP